MDRREEGSWGSRNLEDMRGQSFVVGDRVAKAYQSGRSCNLQVGTVTRIENGKMYMDNSKVAINFPGRLLIVTKLYEKENDV
jgi:hypothetical protein